MMNLAYFLGCITALLIPAIAILLIGRLPVLQCYPAAVHTAAALIVLGLVAGAVTGTNDPYSDEAAMLTVFASLWIVLLIIVLYRRAVRARRTPRHELSAGNLRIEVD